MRHFASLAVVLTLFISPASAITFKVLSKWEALSEYTEILLSPIGPAVDETRLNRFERRRFLAQPLIVELIQEYRQGVAFENPRMNVEAIEAEVQEYKKHLIRLAERQERVRLDEVVRGAVKVVELVPYDEQLMHVSFVANLLEAVFEDVRKILYRRQPVPEEDGALMLFFITEAYVRMSLWGMKETSRMRSGNVLTNHVNMLLKVFWKESTQQAPRSTSGAVGLATETTKTEMPHLVRVYSHALEENRCQFDLQPRD